jgi:hypothetical protein
LLEEQVRAWKDAGGYGFVLDPKPDSTEQIVRFKVEEPPREMSLIISDALHHLNSALNGLMYELAKSWHDPVPSDIAERIEFPIFWDRPMTSGEESRKLGGTDPAAAAVIKGLQPHLKGQGYVDEPLWHLYELARVDRHRFPHLTVATLGGLDIGGDNLHIVTMTVSTGRVIEDGTELGVVKPIDAGRPMNVNLTPSPQLSFGDEPLTGKPVLDTIRDIRSDVIDTVIPAVREYL